jgi:chaperonin GroES
MRVEPAGHRVIVKPDPLEEKSKGGIVIAYGEDKKRVEQAQHTGVIVSVGPNAWKAFDDGVPWAAVGDRVYFAKYGGFLIEQDGEQYRLLNDEDITAIIREDAA